MENTPNTPEEIKSIPETPVVSEVSAEKPVDIPIEKKKTARGVRTILYGLLAVLLFAFTFQLGIEIGFRKATHSMAWGDKYHEMFAGPEQGFFRATAERKEFIEPHGTVGFVMDNRPPTLLIRGRDNIEKNVMVSRGTTIRRLDRSISAQEIQPQDMVVVIGAPGDRGDMRAQFIRVFPGTEGQQVYFKGVRVAPPLQFP